MPPRPNRLTPPTAPGRRPGGPARHLSRSARPRPRSRRSRDRAPRRAAAGEVAGVVGGEVLLHDRSAHPRGRPSRPARLVGHPVVGVELGARHPGQGRGAPAEVVPDVVGVDLDRGRVGVVLPHPLVDPQPPVDDHRLALLERVGHVGAERPERRDVVEAGAAVLVVARPGVEPAHRGRQPEGRERHAVARRPRLGVGDHPAGHRDVGLVHLAHLICVVSRGGATPRGTTQLWCGSGRRRARARRPRACGHAAQASGSGPVDEAGPSTARSLLRPVERLAGPPVPLEHGAHRADDPLGGHLGHLVGQPAPDLLARGGGAPSRRAPGPARPAASPSEQAAGEHQQRVGQRARAAACRCRAAQPAHHHEHGEPEEPERPRPAASTQLGRPEEPPPQGRPHLQGGADDGLVERVGELGAGRRRRVGDRLGPTARQALGGLVADPRGWPAPRPTRAAGVGGGSDDRPSTVRTSPAVTASFSSTASRVLSRSRFIGSGRSARTQRVNGQPGAPPGLVAVVALDRRHDGGDAGRPRRGRRRARRRPSRTATPRSAPRPPRSAPATGRDVGEQAVLGGVLGGHRGRPSRIRRSSTPSPVVAEVVMHLDAGDPVVGGQPRQVAPDLARGLAGEAVGLVEDHHRDGVVGGQDAAGSRRAAARRRTSAGR